MDEEPGVRRPAVPQRLQVGFNYPTFSNKDGFNFGPFPHVDPKDLGEGNPLFAATLPKNLQDLKKMRVNVVRWFIMGNCFNYGPAPQLTVIPPQAIPPRLGKEIWHFDQPDFLDDPKYRGDPDGKKRIFADHFSACLLEFQKAGLKVIPSIIDFHAFLDPFPDQRSPTLPNRARGRGDIIEDPIKRQKFFDFVLKKFLDLARPFKESVYAFEIVNEPTWNVRSLKPAPPKIGNRNIPEPVMREFLDQACTIIEDAGFPSTVGHRFFDDCLKLPTGTKAQYHYYPFTATVFLIPFVPTILTVNDDPDKIPVHSDALTQIRDAQRKVRPNFAAKGLDVEEVFVGEFGCRLPGEFSADHGRLWPELNKADNSVFEIVHERLEHLNRLGYKLAVVWPDLDLTDDTIEKKMSRQKINSLLRFTRGSAP